MVREGVLLVAAHRDRALERVVLLRRERDNRLRALGPRRARGVQVLHMLSYPRCDSRSGFRA